MSLNKAIISAVAYRGSPPKCSLNYLLLSIPRSFSRSSCLWSICSIFQVASGPGLWLQAGQSNSLAGSSPRAGRSKKQSKPWPVLSYVDGIGGPQDQSHHHDLGHPVNCCWHLSAGVSQISTADPTLGEASPST